MRNSAPVAMSTTALPDHGGGDSNSTIAVEGFVIALAVVSVALRFYARRSSKAGLGWDDWLIFVAVVSTVITAILLLVATAIDPDGQRVSVNTDPDYVYRPRDHLYIKLSFVSSVLYFTIVSATQLSALLMYHRLFAVDAAFRRQLAVVSALVVAFWLGCTVANLTNCVPLAWTWIDALDNPAYCFDYNVFWMASGACEVLLDVLILALPVRAVLRLQLSTRKKVTISAVFLLGGFVIITGIVKVILGYVPGAREPSYSRTEVWTTVHAGSAIVCACLPIFKSLVTRISKSAFVSKWTTSSLRSRSYELRGWASVSRSRDRRDSNASIEEEGSSQTELRDAGPPRRKEASHGAEEMSAPLSGSIV